MSQKKCCVLGCTVKITDGVPLHRFPDPVKDAERFSAWVKNTGVEISLTDVGDIHINKRVCRRHFEPNFLYPSNRLCMLAVPNLHVPAVQQTMVIEPVAQSSSSAGNCSGSNEQQESVSEAVPETKGNCSGSNEQQESVSEAVPETKGAKAENIDDDVEYLEEDLYDTADIFENIDHHDDNGSHYVKPTIEPKLSMDEIDNLFASYSLTFRKFSSKLQTMLRLDLAKLFARYEMKNAALQCPSDEQQQAEDDTQSTILSDKTRKKKKRIKRNFSLPQPYITTNNPPKILTYSKKSMMTKSQVSDKGTEGVNKSSSKKNKLSNNEAIIKRKRVRDNEDHDNMVLQTNDQYQKPMKLLKQEKENVGADTLRSQDTGAIILIIDRSSEKLTTESDKISQSQESAS